MTRKAAITVLGPPEEIRGRWREAEADHPASVSDGAAVSFRPAPGGRGTEVHVELTKGGGGPIGEVVGKVAGALPMAKVKDELRRFKQLVETGEVPRSDGSPEGERADRKLKQRPAQPLDTQELQQVGV
jgi:uncharacterized membrane protein